MQDIWGQIWKRTVEKSQINVTNVTMRPLRQAIWKRTVEKKSNKCDQCDYVSSQAGHLRTHLKTHSGEKSNKCNQCGYASYRAGDLKTHSIEKANKCNYCDYACSDSGPLRTHMKIHSGEKPNKCNQCDYASSQVGHLRIHLKTHSEERSNNICLHHLIQVLWRHIWKDTMEKGHINATSVTMHLLMYSV